MATASRTTTRALELLSALEKEPHRFGLFSALRRLECLYADKPRIGEAARPIDEPLRLGQQPSMAFAPSTLAAFESDTRGRSYLATYFFGLFGPNGPLPLHLTEYAHSRELNFDDAAFRRFADIFHHRMLSLFYRAWANAQPVTSLDRPERRRFDGYVGSLIGIAAPEFRDRDSVPDEAKFSLVGRLALATHPAAGLIDVLEDFFGLAFGMRQFVGEWLKLARTDWLVLGEREEAATLGSSSVLGASVWTRQHCFELVCGPLAFADFQRLLPGQSSLMKLRDLARNYIGDELKWTVKLVLREDEVPQAGLGTATNLGWTSWLGQRNSEAHADDVVIDPFFPTTSLN